MQYIKGLDAFDGRNQTAVTLGKFDGLHRGHQKLMHEMLKWKEQGFKIAVFTFATPPWTLVKGKMQTMIMTNPEREMLLEQVGVDYIVEYPFDEEVCHMAPEQFISDILVGRMNAGVIVSGPDCHFGYKAAGDCAMLERLSGEYGYRYFIVDKERDEEGKIISSTYIREMLADGNIRKANDLLGYCYFVTGKVEHGNAIGHTKLYPTANLIPPAVKHLPKFGVYVTRVTVDGKVYGGLTNVGAKPTISGDNPIGVETYLYDFSGDLYGKEMKVELLDFVRPEMKFASIDALKAQLDHDIRECRERYHSFQKSQLG